jgi:hypothetical protein
MNTMMKRCVLFFWLALVASGCLAGVQCDALRSTGLRLLPKTTFEVSYPGLLNGCFSGFLPEGDSLDEGLYRFGVFREGKVVYTLPEVKAGRDLASNPHQHLKILAVSFNDVDGNGQRDVIVIGQGLAAKGEDTFVQLYWGCANDFILDDTDDEAITGLLVKSSVINVKTVERFIAAKKLKAACKLP